MEMKDDDETHSRCCILNSHCSWVPFTWMCFISWEQTHLMWTVAHTVSLSELIYKALHHSHTARRVSRFQMNIPGHPLTVCPATWKISLVAGCLRRMLTATEDTTPIGRLLLLLLPGLRSVCDQLSQATSYSVLNGIELPCNFPDVIVSPKGCYWLERKGLNQK